jgi:hypothetical protein
VSEKKHQAMTIRRRKATSKTQAPETVSIALQTTESVPVTDFLAHTRKLLIARFAEILEMLAQKSAEGSLPHTKYLFEIGGIREYLQREIQDNDEPTLAELLLGEIAKCRNLQASNVVEAPNRQPGDLAQLNDNYCGANAQ